PMVVATPGQPVTVSTDAPAEPAVTAPFVEPTASAPPLPEPSTTPAVDPTLSQTKTEEASGVEKQIQDFIANNPTLTTNSDVSDQPTSSPQPVSIPVSAAPAENTAPEATQPPAMPEPEATTTNPQDQLSNPSPEANDPAKPEPPSHRKLVLTPTDSSINQPVDLNALLAKEEAKTSNVEPLPTPTTNTIIAPSSEPDSSSATTASPNDIAL
ncbi:MAG: hypothetical protein ABIQ89_03480, partial [Candidatus Saccharimonadales bacterium]